MIDEEGYRAGVGIIIANAQNKILWARRLGYRGAWQFPQGGIDAGETPTQAMYRELGEELGLTADCVSIIAETQDWLRYDLPKSYRRYHNRPLCIGQKQKWFLLRLLANDDVIALDQTLEPEFDQWRWVDYWRPARGVIFFKKPLYKAVLSEFEQVLFNDSELGPGTTDAG